MPGNTIAEIAAQFAANLRPEERSVQQPEISRFVRWFGSDRPFSAVNALDVEKYQGQVMADGAPLEQRLSPVKDFLAFAQGQGYLSTNLAKFVRLPRKKEPEKAAKNDTSVVAPEVVALSAAGYAKLREELDHLINVVRPQVARDLYNARLDKDIRENAGYDAAKQHQGLTEARIRELKAVLAHAQIANGENARERSGVGSRVVVRDLVRDREVTYTLVDSREANPREAKISVASPVGRALLDKARGDEVEVSTPGGVLRYRLERIEG